MIKIGIVGGAGYTAGELLRILLWHPKVQIEWIQSTSNAGNPISSVHEDLIGSTDKIFDETIHDNIDLVFVCNGHGKAKSFLENNPFLFNKKIIDLSRDFRLKGTHDFIYGLPEINKTAITSAHHIANPGCFATCIQLGILPLAAAQKLTNEIHVNAITGSTGAGQKPISTTHFSWRNNNVSVYKAFTHQHLDEIKQSITQLQNGFDKSINFIPVRGNFSRGIMTTLYTEFNGTLEEAQTIFHRFYKESPFVIISPKSPHLKQVVNTNKCVLYLEKHDNKLLIVSMIDNLVKGASGQAVHNMNLMFGLDEMTGLGLKPVGF